MSRTLAEHVAAHLRAELAAQEIPWYRLAERLDVDETWVGRRLRGKVAITIDDLDRMSDALGRAPWTFLAPAGVTAAVGS